MPQTCYTSLLHTVHYQTWIGMQFVHKISLSGIEMNRQYIIKKHAVGITYLFK